MSLLEHELPEFGEIVAVALDDMEHPRLPCRWVCGSAYGVVLSPQYIKIRSENGSCTYRRNQYTDLLDSFDFDKNLDCLK